jgi:hypothetical protein
MLPAPDFEFRHRFWLIAPTFALAFACYAFDQRNSTSALAKRLVDPIATRDVLRIILAMACLVVAAGVGMGPWRSAYLQSDILHSAPYTARPNRFAFLAVGCPLEGRLQPPTDEVSLV